MTASETRTEEIGRLAAAAVRAGRDWAAISRADWARTSRPAQYPGSSTASSGPARTSKERR